MATIVSDERAATAAYNDDVWNNYDAAPDAELRPPTKRTYFAEASQPIRNLSQASAE